MSNKESRCISHEYDNDTIIELIRELMCNKMLAHNLNPPPPPSPLHMFYVAIWLNEEIVIHMLIAHCVSIV